MPGRALALGPISLILADSSGRRAGSTLKVVTRAYMDVPLFRHCSHAGPRIAFRSRADNGGCVWMRSLAPTHVVGWSCSLATLQWIGADTACFQLRRML